MPATHKIIGRRCRISWSPPRGPEFPACREHSTSLSPVKGHTSESRDAELLSETKTREFLKATAYKDDSSTEKAPTAQEGSPSASRDTQCREWDKVVKYRHILCAIASHNYMIHMSFASPVQVQNGVLSRSAGSSTTRDSWAAVPVKVPLSPRLCSGRPPHMVQAMWAMKQNVFCIYRADLIRRDGVEWLAARLSNQG
jgi:hypothetical protein